MRSLTKNIWDTGGRNNVTYIIFSHATPNSCFAQGNYSEANQGQETEVKG